MLFRRLRRFISESLENEEWLTDRKLDSQLSIIAPQRHLYAHEYDLKKLEDVSLDSSATRPPSLCHGLHRIIRTEGIYPSEQFPQISRTHPKVIREVYSRFSNYVKPSSNSALLELTQAQSCKYMSGSSSLTEALQQIFYVISNFKFSDITGLGKNYDHLNMNYMSAYRKPITFFLRKLPGGVYAVDGDKGPSIGKENYMLLMGGIVLESLCTT